MQVRNLDYREIFLALADPLRVRALRLLVTTGDEACLCEFVDTLQEPEYKLSRHLKALKQSGLTTSEKDGRWIYHRLAKRGPFLSRLFSAVMEIPDDGTFAEDLKRFRGRKKLRKNGRCRTGIQTQKLTGGRKA
jgi:ArsR family transcriptional regulator, arsenate/arsenite/antimonite-responsive transcriptional repressor